MVVIIMLINMFELKIRRKIWDMISLVVKEQISHQENGIGLIKEFRLEYFHFQGIIGISAK